MTDSAILQYNDTIFSFSIVIFLFQSIYPKPGKLCISVTVLTSQNNTNTIEIIK